MKGKVAIDTSALISLGHTELLDRLISAFDIIVTTGVVEELKEMSRIDDEDGRAAKEWLDRAGSITVIDVPRKDPAEDELMGICKKEGIPLVLDDIRACKRMDKDIQWFFSVHLVFLLFYKGIITKESAKIGILKMRKERNWKKNAISIMANSLFDL